MTILIWLNCNYWGWYQIETIVHNFLTWLWYEFRLIKLPKENDNPTDLIVVEKSQVKNYSLWVPGYKI